MATWIIEDWMGNHVFPDQSFDSFESARGHIAEHADLIAQNEDEYDGICEDLYAIPIPETTEIYHNDLS